MQAPCMYAYDDDGEDDEGDDDSDNDNKEENQPSNHYRRTGSRRI